MTITRKRIRHLYIRVDPDAVGIVSAPVHLTDARFGRGPIPGGLIQRRVERVRSRTIPAADDRSTQLFGEAIPLEIHEGCNRRSIVLTDGVLLVINVRQSVVSQDRTALLEAWHRAHLAKRIPGIVARWEPVLG